MVSIWLVWRAFLAHFCHNLLLVVVSILTGVSTPPPSCAGKPTNGYIADWIPAVLRPYFDGSIGRAEALPASSAERDAGDAKGASLDLIQEHLTDRTRFKPCQTAGYLLKNWVVPIDWEPPINGERSPVLKIQPFKQGGYEATVRFLDLAKISRAIEFGGRKGTREVRNVPDREHAIKAGSRAKRKVRHLTKNMGATHLATFTRRESDPAKFWSIEEWAKAWDRLRRAIEKVLGPFPYVAVPEYHAKGNFHLHVAWCGRINLNVIRPIWWSICGGRGMGNVDAQYIKVRQGLERSDRVAKYLSKYITKSFAETGRFNRKRYWASRQKLEDARRYVLRARCLNSAITEIQHLLGLDWSKFIERRLRGSIVNAFAKHLFVFPDSTGLWLSYIPELHSALEPPF